MVATLNKHERAVILRLVKRLRREANRCLAIIERSQHTSADERALQWRVEEIGLLRRVLRD